MGRPVDQIDSPGAAHESSRRSPKAVGAFSRTAHWWAIAQGYRTTAVPWATLKVVAADQR